MAEGNQVHIRKREASCRFLKSASESDGSVGSKCSVALTTQMVEIEESREGVY